MTATADGAPVLLEVRDLRKSYRGLRAVDGISFDIAPGELLGIIGPNGAGKTTLLNSLSGSPRSDTGTIMLSGRRVDRLAAHRRARLGMVRTFQRVNLFTDMTVLDNIVLGFENAPPYGALRAIFGRHRRIDRTLRESARELLAKTGLDTAAWDQPVRDLGQGEQRLVELARVTAAKPRLLLLDEPTVGMGEEDVAAFGNWLSDQQATGVAVILVSHDMRFVLSRCDRVLAMHFGRTLAQGDPQRVRSNTDVIAAYLG